MKKSANKTVVVLGATGLVGKHLVLQLSEAEDIQRIVTLTRREVSYASAKCENHVVDFENLSEHSELFQGDVLFSCLGTTVKQAGSIKAQRRVDLDYQLDAAKLAAEQGVKHYVLVSSSGANPKSLSPYLKMKGELETAVLGLAFPQVSIVQPSLLLGERSQSRTAEGLAAKLMPSLCKLPGLSKYRPIQGSEVARKMIELVRVSKPGVSRLALDEVFPNSIQTDATL